MIWDIFSRSADSAPLVSCMDGITSSVQRKLWSETLTRCSLEYGLAEAVKQSFQTRLALFGDRHPAVEPLHALLHRNNTVFKSSHALFQSCHPGFQRSNTGFESIEAGVESIEASFNTINSSIKALELLEQQLETGHSKRSQRNSNTEDCDKFRRHNLPWGLTRPAKLVHRLRPDRIPLFTVSMIGTMVPRHRHTLKPSRGCSHDHMGAVVGERAKDSKGLTLYCGLFPALRAINRRQEDLQGEDGYRAMTFGLGVLGDDIVHGLQGVRPKEHLAALGADFRRDVAKNVQLPFPAVDVLDAALFDWGLARWACCHIIPFHLDGAIKCDGRNAMACSIQSSDRDPHQNPIQ